MRIGSLFSGIGGLELGLEWSGLGRTVWQVEQDAGCRHLLAHYWPGAQRFEDVRDVGAANLSPVDLICGGFPCQDVSSAGRRAGLTGERSGLWREFARIVGELGPRWVVVENVASGARSWVDPVVRELGQLGYECLPLPVSADAVGAPHRRERIFIVARAVGREVADHDEIGCRQRVGGGEKNTGRAVLRDDCTELARRGHHAFPPGPLDQEGWKAWLASGGPEPVLRRGAHGAATKLDGAARRARIRALGNAVVPQCAEVAGWVIRELDGV